MRAWPLLLLLPAVACAALRDDMRRAETAFDEARYENVNVWLRDLEPSVADMPRPLRARYYYIAGVTAVRLQRRREARHYLLLCREEASREGYGLTEERVRNLELTLAELE